MTGVGNPAYRPAPLDEDERAELDRLRDERKLGPMVAYCPNLECRTLRVGSAYTICPGCGGELRPLTDKDAPR